MNKHKLWVVDDEESIRTVCRSALEDHFQIETFSNGSEALLALNSDKPDLIITDPPRDGMHKKVVEQLLKIKSKRIVYISCNSATQARDIALLKEKYLISKMQTVDMFPHTHHIENILILELR